MINPFIIPVAYADVNTLVQKVNKVILNPLIVLMFAIALMYFLYGVFEFLTNTEDVEKRADGKTHMLWGVVGMFIMMAVFTIMSIITNTLGADKYIKDNGHGGDVILDQQ
jgi:uncharacterized membrane protein YidH (DUF202 family)